MTENATDNPVPAADSGASVPTDNPVPPAEKKDETALKDATVKKENTSRSGQDRLAAQAKLTLEEAASKAGITPEEMKAQHLLETANTVKDENGKFVFPDWKKIHPEKMAEITSSVGIQLYFMMLKYFGWLFFALLILSMPQFIMNVMGNMVENAKGIEALSRTSIANIGRCPEDGCYTFQEIEERCLAEEDCDPEEDPLVSDVTVWLGLLDGVGLFILMAFGFIFKVWVIPRTVQQFDRSVVTPADFTLDVTVLPRTLDGDMKSESHVQYEAKMKQHFTEVLKNLQVEPVDDPEAVVKVVLVREYDGAIFAFMNKGIYLQDAENAKLAIAEAKTGKEKIKAEKYVEKVEKYIQQADDKLASHAGIPDDQRAVCRAFVTFKSMIYKEKVEYEYRFAKYRMFRCCQTQPLRFEGMPIRVDAAPEPSDLFWENLDFNTCNRRCRQVFIFILSLIVLIICAFILLAIKSRVTKASPEAFPVWIVEGDGGQTGNGCFELCDIEAFAAANCHGQPTDASFSDWMTKDISPMPSPSVEQCQPVYTSNACTGTPVDGKNWIALRFYDQAGEPHPTAVSCMSMIQVASAVKSVNAVKIYGCESAPEAGDSDMAAFKPADYCTPMQLVKVNKVKKDDDDEGVASGKIPVMKDSTCAAKVSIKVAEESKKRCVARCVEEDDDMDEDDCDEECGVTDPTVNCFCKQSLQSNPKALADDDTPEGKLCKDWTMERVYTFGRMVGAVLAVCLINQLLLLAFGYFIAFERHATLSDFTLKQLLMLFWAQFINTALLTFFVNFRAELPGFFEVLTQMVGIGNGSYFEETAEWFSAVGTALIITLISQVFSNTVPSIVMTLLVNPFIRMFNVWFAGARTKDVVLRYWQFPEWNLALRGAQTMNVICTIVMYSSGMPILYWAGAAYALISYWIDKHSLIMGSKRPPAYSAGVAITCMHFVPFAVILHAIFACRTFGNPLIVPSDYNVPLRNLCETLSGKTLAEYQELRDTWLVASQKQREEMYNDYASAKVLDWSREACVVTLLIVIFGITFYSMYYLNHYILSPIMQPVFMSLRALFAICFKRCVPEIKAESNKTWDEALETLTQSPLPTTYEMKENAKYEAAAFALYDTINQKPHDPKDKEKDKDEKKDKDKDKEKDEEKGNDKEKAAEHGDSIS